MDPAFQPGERLTAHILGLTVRRVETDHGGRSWLYLTYDDPTMLDIALPVDGIRYERVTPADGEPQPGELWADQAENLYLARARHCGTELVCVDDQSSSESWEPVHQGMYGPIYRVAQRPLIGGQS